MFDRNGEVNSAGLWIRPSPITNNLSVLCMWAFPSPAGVRFYLKLFVGDFAQIRGAPYGPIRLPCRRERHEGAVSKDRLRSPCPFSRFGFAK